MPNYSISQIQSMIRSAAQKYGVDPNLALAVAAHESNFNPNAINTANANHQWLILVFHRIDESGDYSWSSENLEEIAEYLYTLEHGSTI